MGSTGNGFQDGWASEPIAIIGMSSKFAGDATNTENLWRMLVEGRSGWTPFPESRFKLSGVYHPNNERLNSTHVKGAHFLAEDVGLFDAAFFSYSSETASSLDPQYRLQLESVYEALENAGLSMHEIAGSNTSVFAGVFVHDYRDGLLRDADNLPRLLATGTGVPMMSNRVSHFFDLRGASMTIETACSSGMVTMHQGIQSLRTREADMSIIGGANLTLNPDMFKALGSAGFLSADGKSYAFDSRASGYGRGEGVATIVIKRLGDALAAGDPIRGVIRGSLLNQDGKTETITTPSLEAQEALVRACYQNAGLDLRDTQYFEAHGTGTQAGDTIEARAIANVFAPIGEPLLIGSIKTNVGHTEASSGLASIIKTALAIERGVIPPSINFEKPNPKIDLDGWNLRLVRELQSWPEATTRRASINNFGYGGANAHIIMEGSASWVPSRAAQNGYSNGHSNGHSDGHSNGHSERNPDIAKTNSKVLMLSAKDEQACQKMVTNLSYFLEGHRSTPPEEEEFLESLAYTLGQRRTRFPWTTAYPISVTEGFDSVIKSLRSPKFKPSRSSRKPRIGMVFTGQGAQWHAMGRELVDFYPIYKASLEEGERYLKEFGAEWSLMQELSRDAASTRINEVILSTPICVALQISLVRLLRAWGVVPVAVTSHSSGEIAAAYAVGALSYREAMAFSYYRAILAADEGLRLPVRGGMIAVGLGLEETESYLKRLTSKGKAVVACVNSPSSITVAGDLSAIEELEDLANAEGVFARRLKIDTAWHSHHMAPIAKVYVEALQRMKPEDHSNNMLESVTFSSPVTGGRLSSAKAISRPGHWVDSLLRPVQFVAAMTDMVLGELDSSTSNVDLIIEVGPHTALGGPIQQILALPEFEELQIPYFGCLVRKTNAADSMQTLAAGLLQEGYDVKIEAVNFPHGKRSHVKVLTELPSYPWNHQIKHWAEPRFNKAIRERSVPPHDLLGSLVEGSNPTTPSWRHILRISESPWTRDHVIQSNILYPAAGYICLAIEAISQHSTLDRTTAVNGISGYRLRDVEFLQALMIPDSSDGIEIQTTMRPVNQKDIGVEGWKDFEVWSVTSDNRWTQHAKGLIMIELESANSFNLAENNSEIKGHAKRIIPADLFANLRALGIAHGPMFQNMKSIVQSGSDMRSIAVMSVPDVSVPNDLPREHVIHPVTLDSVITAPYSAVRGAAAYESTAKVPRSIKSFWVSSNISHEVDHLFRAHSLITHDDTHGMEAEVYLSNDDGGQVVLEMKGFSYQSLGQNVSFQQAERWEKELCSRVGWSPDISIRSPATFELIKEQLSCKTNSMEDAATKEIWRVCIYFIQQAVRQLTSNDLDGMEVHYTLYYAWMKEKLEQAASGQLCAGSADWLSDKEPEKQHRIEQVAKSGVDGEMVCRLGAQLVDIMRAEVTLVDLMAQDDLLSKYNSETPRVKRRGSQVSGLLGHLVHKNPRARILEIGAGKGVMTRYALEALGTTTSGGPQASSYHYTDTSAASFDLARETFSQWEDLLSFDVLDIGLDPVSQGFTGGAYDIVIASHVLSATKSISRTLNNLKSLLKQGGVLLFTEDVPNQIDALFVKGLLPNWWSSEEDERKSGPLLSTPIWDRYLQVAGFSGADFEVQDCESTELCSSTTVMSTLTEPVSSKLRMDPEKIVIVTSKKAGFPPTSWLELLQQSDPSCVETDKGKLLTVKNLECNTATAQWYADKICIFVGEMNEPILYDLDSSSLEGIRVMSTNCKELVWVTRGGAVNCERPELSLAPGFIRSLRGEYVGRKFLTLDLDPRGPLWSEVGAGTIARVVQTGFGKPEDGSVAGKAAGEFEYAERNGIVLIPRFHHYVSMDKMISSSKSEFVTPQTMSKEPFYQPDRPMCLDLESLAFTDISNADAYFRELPASLLEVEPRAYGMSLHATNDSIMGLECAGIVTRVGSEAAENGYAVGNRVLCVLDESSLSNRVIVKWTSAAHIPAELSFQEAASIPEAFLTAFYSLIEVARLQRNQSVLIHAGAGSVGQAAIMVAQHLGAVILTTVGSLEERDLVIQKYGIPNSHIFDNNNTSFVADVLAVTRHNGVDAVLNSLRGALLQESFKLVAQMGCFIEVGKHDLEKNNNLEMGSFARHISFSAVDLPILLEHRASEVQRCLKEIVGLFEAKAFLPVYPLNTYAISDIAEVSDALKTVRILGKTVLSVGSQDMVPVLSSKPAVKLSADASYLIVGGNGGLGQSVAHWMVSRGARNIVLLSRSALTSEKTAALAEELKEAGCSRVLLASGDVASEDDLNRAIRKCAEDGLPPIRGVIHAAFVLRDSFVEKMTLEDYKHTTQSKVAGVWNLHNEFNLPGDLDFFILFSSINGIMGYPSQSAYSAAGAYEDALAHYRVKQCGLPAVSIDLSVVNAIGYVAESAAAEAMQRALVKAGRRVIDEDHVIASLEAAILFPYEPQFVVGGINSGPGPHWDVDGDLGRDMRFLPLKYRQPSTSALEQQQQDRSDSLAAKMSACTSQNEAIAVVESAMAEMLADMFLVPIDEINMKESPSQQGVDSLMAVEVRNMLFSQAGSELSIFNILQSPSLSALAADVVNRSTHVKIADT